MSFKLGGYTKLTYMAETALQPAGETTASVAPTSTVLREDDLVSVVLETVDIRDEKALEDHDLVLNVEVTSFLERKGSYDRDTMAYVIGPVSIHAGGSVLAVQEHLLYIGPVGKALQLSVDAQVRKLDAPKTAGAEEVLEAAAEFLGSKAAEGSAHEFSKKVDIALQAAGSGTRVATLLQFDGSLYPEGMDGAANRLLEGVYLLKKETEGSETPLLQARFRVTRHLRKDESSKDAAAHHEEASIREDAQGQGAERGTDSGRQDESGDYPGRPLDPPHARFSGPQHSERPGHDYGERRYFGSQRQDGDYPGRPRPEFDREPHRGGDYDFPRRSREAYQSGRSWGHDHPSRPNRRDNRDHGRHRQGRR